MKIIVFTASFLAASVMAQSRTNTGRGTGNQTKTTTSTAPSKGSSSNSAVSSRTSLGAPAPSAEGSSQSVRTQYSEAADATRSSVVDAIPQAQQLGIAAAFHDANSGNSLLSKVTSSAEELIATVTETVESEDQAIRDFVGNQVSTWVSSGEPNEVATALENANNVFESAIEYASTTDTSTGTAFKYGLSAQHIDFSTVQRECSLAL